VSSSADPLDVTLVIPGRNAAGTVAACLDAATKLLGRDGLQEIIFVDDGSTDATAEIVSEYPVRCIRGVGKGPGAARNLGWRAAETPLVWFIDADCVPQPDALRHLQASFDDENVAGVGGSYNNLRADSLLACLIHEEIVARHGAMPRDVNFLGSFNVVYRRQALAEVGGFDEVRVNGPGRAGAEDAELACRMCEHRFQLHFEPASRVGHFHPTRWISYMRTQCRHGYFRVAMYLRHPARVKGDSYSGWLDFAQPPLAMLSIAFLPLSLWPPMRMVEVVALVLLAALQIPMTMRMLRRRRSMTMLAYAPMGFLRAFHRGIGMTAAVLQHGLGILPMIPRIPPGRRTPVRDC